MSGYKIDKIIAKSLGKAGKILGYPFSVYRVVANGYVVPLQDQNFVTKAMMSWTEDTSYEKNPEDVLTFFKLYMDYRNTFPGDILFSEDLGRTFIVTELNPLRGAVAVQTPDMMNVYRATSTPTADVKITNVPIVNSMPCVINFSGAQENKGSMQAVHGVTHVVSGQTHAEIWTWMQPGTLKLNDIVEIEGNKYVINSLSGKHKGTFIMVRSIKAGI